MGKTGSFMRLISGDKKSLLSQKYYLSMPDKSLSPAPLEE